MNNWISIGIFIWTSGFLPRLFNIRSIEGETIYIPKLMSVFYLVFDKKIPLPIFIFQTIGILMIVYGLVLSEYLTNSYIDTLLGILVPVFVTRIMVSALLRQR